MAFTLVRRVLTSFPTAASDAGVCTKHLLRLDPATRKTPGLTGAESRKLSAA